MDFTEREMEAVHQTMFRLERPWVSATPDASVFFAYEALPVAHFLSGLRHAMALTNGRRLLDLGCGIGTKLALAHYLGCQVAGIDRFKPYLEAAAGLVPEAELTLSDIRDVDMFDADVVYMYRPGVSDQTAVMLEQHVKDRVAKGTVLFLPTRGEVTVA